MINQFKSRQFLIFLVAGGTAASVNFVSRIVYSHWMSFSWAVIVAYLTGMAVAFVLFKLFVFRNASSTSSQSVVSFVLVNVLGIAQTWLISMGLARYLFPMAGMQLYPQELAHAVGILVPAFTSYLGHKHFSFKQADPA